MIKFDTGISTSNVEMPVEIDSITVNTLREYKGAIDSLASELEIAYSLVCEEAVIRESLTGEIDEVTRDLLKNFDNDTAAAFAVSLPVGAGGATLMAFERRLHGLVNNCPEIATVDTLPHEILEHRTTL